MALACPPTVLCTCTSACRDCAKRRNTLWESSAYSHTKTHKPHRVCGRNLSWLSKFTVSEKQKGANPQVGFFSLHCEHRNTNNSLHGATWPLKPMLHKGSNPTIKVLIKRADTLYWCSKSSLSQRSQRWIVYYRLFVASWSLAQGCHRFLIIQRFQFKCLINYSGNPSLRTEGKPNSEHEKHQHTCICVESCRHTGILDE